MFKVDEEVNAEGEDELDISKMDDKPFEIGQDPYAKPTIQEKIKGETTVAVTFNGGNKFLQLRIPKRYQHNNDEFKTLFDKSLNKNKNAEDVKDDILKRENEIFLNWRRNLNNIETEMMQKYKYDLSNKKDFLKYKMNKITPYEKSLDIWRQLWITVESCELLCIIIDSRNPLFFKNKDLEDYIKQLGKK